MENDGFISEDILRLNRRYIKFKTMYREMKASRKSTKKDKCVVDDTIEEASEYDNEEVPDIVRNPQTKIKRLVFK